MSMGPRQVAVTTLLATLVAAGLLTGCGSHAAPPSSAGVSGSPGSSVAPAPSASAVVSASPSAGGSPFPSAPAGGGSTGGPVPVPTGGTSPAAGDITLQGQVETGAEPSCLMLRSDGHLYHLLNGDTSVVRAGNNVVVQGHVVKGVMSHCMQGMPFLVTHARAA